MTMPQSSRPYLRAPRRLVVALVALLVAAAPTTVGAQASPPAEGPVTAAAATDSLWAGNTHSVGVCASPSSQASLADCFAQPVATWPDNFIQYATTDGVNVYFAGSDLPYATQYGGGLSCPISGMGANCTRIMAGPWDNSSVESLAAGGGYIYIGQNNGAIYRCPNDLPYSAGSSAPAQCTLLDDAGSRAVDSLLLANDTLYAGLAYYGTEQSKQGLLWTCSADVANSCTTLDSYGKTWANSMVAGGGHLWVGLGNGIIWRCDPTTANKCDTYDIAGGGVTSLSYDGQDTLYAAVEQNNQKSNGVIWSCPTDTQNACSNLLTGISQGTVAAGAGSVFSSNGTGNYLNYGTTPFTNGNNYPAGSPSTPYWFQAALLYIPADGPTGVGAVSAKVKRPTGALRDRIATRCRAGKNPSVPVTVKSGTGNSVTHRVRLCRVLRNTKAVTVPTYELVDPGKHVVTARSSGLRARATVTVKKEQTSPLRLRLSRG